MRLEGTPEPDWQDVADRILQSLRVQELQTKETRMAIHTITLTVNGAREHLDVPANMTLLQLLRERLALTGTKNGCEAGECGACTVLLDGEPVNSCMMLAVEADGREVLTVEGLAPEGQLSPLQEAFAQHNAVQCGFCTPGMLMSATALLERNPRPSEEEIKAALLGNLCRCTGYVRIIASVAAAAATEDAERGEVRHE
jgi:carbon-monoxide dehydrogenase small subunit